MNAARTQQIESMVMTIASAVFAAATAFACLGLGRVLLALEPMSVIALAGAGAFSAFLACRHMLGAIDRAPHAYALQQFELPALEPLSAAGVEELVLTDGDRLSAAPLDLDDVLPELPEDSRVVQLFDPRSMPTPGELHARIDSHFGGSALSGSLADASQDLFDALAELRRSLR